MASSDLYAAISRRRWILKRNVAAFPGSEETLAIIAYNQPDTLLHDQIKGGQQL
jgi:chromosome segregation and condensation protein ScpB